MIAVIDCGAGNLHSVLQSFADVNARAEIVTQPEACAAAHGLVLPGVGAFADAMVHLRRAGMLGAVRSYAKSGRPLLGICLGMQLLFDYSDEHGRHPGLGILAGGVARLHGAPKALHIGWNQLVHDGRHPLLEGVPAGAYAYFVHGFAAQPEDPQQVVATAEFGGKLPAVVARGSVLGVQFHPEKSGAVGLRILKNFYQMCEEAPR
ncbi:MAG: imidazole glycerol phosphate synthase subunit HisH [Firmicutes bacterium]|nr:imidazole glycerol phosphate synthase subunit HisH [Bacillota bacterium]